MGVGRRLREILPYSHGDAQKHGHESVNNSDAQKPSIDIRQIPAFPFTNRDSAEFNLARFSPLNVSRFSKAAGLSFRHRIGPSVGTPAIPMLLWKPPPVPSANGAQCCPKCCP